MKPVLFHIGSLPLYSFGVMVALGVIFSLVLMKRRAAQTGFPPGDGALDMVFVIVLAGFFGGRAYYVLQNAEWYFKHPAQIFALWEGGLVFYGGLLSAFAAFWIFLRIRGESLARGLDFILPYVALTHAFGRLGCFLNGCCFGKVCDWPWAVSFPDVPHPVHPAQLYEAAGDFILFLFLNQKYTAKKFDGQIACLYFMLYAVLRFAVEFLREDSSHWGGFSMNQWISSAVFTAAVFFYDRQRRKAGENHA